VNKKWSQAYKDSHRQITLFVKELLTKRRRLGKVKGSFERTRSGKSSGVYLTRDTR